MNQTVTQSTVPANQGHLEGFITSFIEHVNLIQGYIVVFAVAFIVTLVATPIMRRLAVANGIIDRPSDPRKIHKIPVAYLGGVGVYLGLVAAVLLSYTNHWHGLIDVHQTRFESTSFFPPVAVPFSILVGMTVIMLIGLWDDVAHIDPRLKIAGQLFAAAALAYEDVGVKLAAGIMLPVAEWFAIPTIELHEGAETLGFFIPLPTTIAGADAIPVDVLYWVGTGIIAIFVLGACNASNLIDGLDGLLSGTTAICVAGLIIIGASLAAVDDGPRDASRLIFGLALLGACMGFLPHNFNPATIFLGDCGSLLLGYCTIVIILTLGDTGQTDLVLAGLIIYAIPIIDTTLAIVRRKMAGKSISDADDQHLHHMLKRALGVKGAVFTLYGIGIGFAILGVLLTFTRGRVTYVLALVFAAYIGVTAIKIARRAQIESEAHSRLDKERGAQTTTPETTGATNGHADTTDSTPEAGAVSRGTA